MKLNTWSKDYQSAKKDLQHSLKFLDQRGIDVKHEKLDILEDDPFGNKLYIDVIKVGNTKAKKLYLSTSGIHGVEGFAGSAIQLSLLNNLETLPDDVCLLFFHVLNPWGMAWIRRDNESNVDLNRNFLPENEEYSGCHEHYSKLDPLINIKKIPKGFDFFKIKMIYHALMHGKTRTKQAYAEGQYTFPKGLHFGGFKLEKGPHAFIEYLKTNLHSVESCCWIDLHTGLGKSGEDYLLVDLPLEDKKYKYLKKQNFGDRIMSLDPKAGVAYKIRGGMQKGVELLFQDINWTSITQEFGTIPSIDVIQALRIENCWTHYGNKKGSDILNHWSKCKLLEAFRPENKIWQDKIISRGSILFNQTFNYLIK